ncbi:armadillo-type protein [Glomus cerebriforme]|uniref:Armadillo-type protein n=1 Tax=Glomus cerebriforme TaxID=658196 RepID=A0A397TQ88_9GLOM|nr:armadillo-type protein [Glomus cerebriforme]
MSIPAATGFSDNESFSVNSENYNGNNTTYDAHESNDFDILTQIIQALDIIYNPLTTNESRIKAQEYCDSIKDHPLSPIYGRYLAHSENNLSPMSRHFGLHLLENAVKFKWNDGTYNNEEKHQIKQAIIELIERGIQDILTEQLFIKEKVAKLFAEVANKEWPLIWNDMDKLLQRLYSESPTTQEIVLFICRYLAEETEIRDSLQCVIVSSNILRIQYPDGLKKESRREDSGNVTIMFGDDPNNEGWLIRWTRSLEQTVGECQNQKRLPNPNMQIILVQEKLTIAILNTLAATLDWVLIRSIAESNIIFILCNCLLIDCYEIRMEAIECLAKIFSRNFQGAEDRAIVFEPLFEKECMDLLYNAYNKIQPAGKEVLLKDDEYTYLKRFTETITDLGVRHICFKNISVMPKQFPKYLELIYIISKHSSNMITSISIEFWHAAMKNNFISKIINEQERLPIMLLELFTERLSILFQPSEHIETPTSYYMNLDFDSQNDYRIFGQILRSTKVIEIIKSVTIMRPIEVFKWMIDRIQITFNVRPNIESLDVDGVLKIDSGFYIKFDAEMILMESVVIGLGKLIKNVDNENGNINDEDRKQILNEMNNLLQMLLEITYEDVLMTHRYLTALEAFEDILQIDSRLLFQVLQKMFTFVTFCPSGHVVSKNPLLPFPIKRLRFGAITTLIKFGVAMPDNLINIYSDIYNYINGIIDKDKHLVTGKEKSSLLEFLISIVYFSKIPLEQKKPLFDSIVCPIINNLQKINVNSIQEFLDNTGFSFLIKMVNEKDGTYAYSEGERISKLNRNITWLLTTILSWLKRTTEYPSKEESNTVMIEASNLWQQYIPSILTITLSFIRMLHQVWNTEIWREFPIEIHSIISLSNEDKAKIIGMSQKSTMIESQHSVDGMIDSLRKWLSSTRIDCYYILGRLPLLGSNFYTALPNVNELLAQSLFENAEWINNIHWKFLLNIVIKPYILNCPTPSIHSSFLPQLLKYIDEKLSKEWNALVIKGVQISTMEEAITLEQSLLEINSDEFEEIFNEKVLRDLTRAYVDLLEPIFGNSVKKGGKITNKGVAVNENNELKEYMLDYMPITEPFLMSLCHLITYKDSVSCIRITRLCAKLLPSLIKQEGLREFVGKELLTSALQALHDGYHKEAHPSIISLITDIYIDLRPISSVPFETFANLLNMDYGKLQKFEVDLSQATESKTRKSIVKKFLERITGVSKGEWFKINTTEQNKSSKKTFVGNYTKPQIGILDVVNDSGQVGLDNLFDE